MDNLITEAIKIAGLKKLSVAMGITHQAVRKFETARRLPRTDFTGETDYAAAIERVTDGRVPRSVLRAWSLSAYQPRKS